MAKALKAKGYEYKCCIAKNATHGQWNVVEHTLPGALEWLWQDYKPVSKYT